mmetsp:Transcript_8149/g.27133  ORF Transcript_8149/g.27133 Transcript_8149/m.27133 type:complete len:411 (-) Transcript_8149:820-2052(-)
MGRPDAGGVGLYVLVRADGGPLRARRRHILLDGGDGSQVPPGDARAASRPLLLGRLLEAHFLVVRRPLLVLDSPHVGAPLRPRAPLPAPRHPERAHAARGARPRRRHRVRSAGPAAPAATPRRPARPRLPPDHQPDASHLRRRLLHRHVRATNHLPPRRCRRRIGNSPPRRRLRSAGRRRHRARRRHHGRDGRHPRLARRARRHLPRPRPLLLPLDRRAGRRWRWRCLGRIRTPPPRGAAARCRQDGHLRRARRRSARGPPLSHATVLRPRRGAPLPLGAALPSPLRARPRHRPHRRRCRRRRRVRLPRPRARAADDGELDDVRQRQELRRLEPPPRPHGAAADRPRGAKQRRCRTGVAVRRLWRRARPHRRDELVRLALARGGRRRDDRQASSARERAPLLRQRERPLL